MASKKSELSVKIRRMKRKLFFFKVKVFSLFVLSTVISCLASAIVKELIKTRVREAAEGGDMI